MGVRRPYIGQLIPRKCHSFLTPFLVPDRRQRDRYHTKLEQEVRQTTVEEVVDEVEAQTEYPEQFEVPGAEKEAGC